MTTSVAARNDAGERMLMCMYKGPGPAIYKLRPLTGTHDHCRTKPQAPAHSVGSPYKFVPVGEGPGPVYNIDPRLTTNGKHEGPTPLVTKRPKSKGIEQLPGPGEYDPKLLSDGQPSITMGLYAPVPLKRGVPAPNAYDIKNGIGVKSATLGNVPEVAVRSRSFFGSPYYLAHKGSVPGPGAYTTPENRTVYQNRGGPFTLKSRNEYPENPMSAKYQGVPGPGSYNPCDGGVYSRQNTGFSRQNTGFSMGVKHSKYEMPIYTKMDMYY